MPPAFSTRHPTDAWCALTTKNAHPRIERCQIKLMRRLLLLLLLLLLLESVRSRCVAHVDAHAGHGIVASFLVGSLAERSTAIEVGSSARRVGSALLSRTVLDRCARRQVDVVEGALHEIKLGVEVAVVLLLLLRMALLLLRRVLLLLLLLPRRRLEGRRILHVGQTTPWWWWSGCCLRGVRSGTGCKL